MLHFARRLPDAADGDIAVDHRFKRLFRFRALVRGYATERLEIVFRRHWLDRVYLNAIGPYLQGQLLEPLMYDQLLRRDTLLMHAAGVVDDGEAVLLAAHGGTGKTSLSLALMSHGFPLLGDDLIMVDVPARVASPYARPLHIFTYNVGRLRNGRVPVRYRIAIWLKDRIRTVLGALTGQKFLISTRIHADEVYPDIRFGAPSPLGRLVILTRDLERPERVAVAGRVDEIVAEIIDTADLNDDLYRLVGERRDEVEERERAVIGALVRGFDEIVRLNPRKLDLDDLPAIRRALDGE
ncbi:MAG: hypothetical protein QM675_02005 [Protaetiibacter sp.]